MKRVILTIVISCLLVGCTSNVPSWQDQYDLGNRYLNEGNYEEAIIAFSSAIEIDSMNADTYIARAKVYLSMSSNEENLLHALADYEMAVELGVTDIDIYVQIADIYVQLGEYDKAIDILNSVLIDNGYSFEMPEELVVEPIKLIAGNDVNLNVNGIGINTAIGPNTGVEQILYDPVKDVKYFVTTTDFVAEVADTQAYFRIMLAEEQINIKESPYIAMGISITGPEISSYDVSICLNTDDFVRDKLNDDRLWAVKHELPNVLEKYIIDTTEYVKGGGKCASGYAGVEDNDVFGAIRIRLADDNTLIPAGTKVEMQYLAFFDNLEDAQNYNYMDEPETKQVLPEPWQDIADRIEKIENSKKAE